jgi:hypothetical protein
VRTLAEVVAALVLCGGLSWHLARAVAEGLWGATGEFVRTPKSGSKPGSGPRSPRPRPVPTPAARRPRGAAAGLPELALAALFTFAALCAAGSGRPGAVPFLLALSAGLAWVGLATRRATDAPAAHGS